MATSSQLRSHCDYTIGWICALGTELTAATVLLDKEHDPLPIPLTDQNTYTLGSIGKHNIVIACLPVGKYGTNSAAATAISMVSTFPSVRFGLMVGIGGGIPSNKVRLGDVVVSCPCDRFPGVVQWDYGKVEQGKFRPTGSLNNPPNALLTALQVLGSKRERNKTQIKNQLDIIEQKRKELDTEYRDSESLCDYRFADDCPHIEGSSQDIQMYDAGAEEEEEEEEVTDCRFRDFTRAQKRELGVPQVHYGLIASGNMVIKDAKYRDQLNESFGGKVLCVEMESAGLMDNFPCLVIRGICDYADAHKNKAWQAYAATVAASFAKDLLLVVPSREVEKMGVITTSMISDISKHIEESRAHRDTKQDANILEWLSPLDYGAEHSDILKRWQPGTAEWLIESAEFKEFVETRHPVLFCSGMPGAGKTIVAAVVVDHLHRLCSENPQIGVGYIYFNFNRHQEQTPEAIFSSLLRQLSHPRPSLPQSVKKLHEIHEERKTRPQLKEIMKAFRSVVGMYSKVFIVFDAFDECARSDQCRDDIVSEIKNCTKACSLKLFITSRHLTETPELFSPCLRLEIRATESDVRKYIEYRLSKLPDESIIGQDVNLKEKITTGITSVVNGMFLLAYLHFDRLAGCISKREIMKTLESLPTGSYAYDHAYNAALLRINSASQQSPSQSKLAMNALSLITNAKRALLAVELQYALGVEIGTYKLDEDNNPSTKEILSTTLGLVTHDEKSDIIRLVHYTTQEFFKRTQTQWFPNAGNYIAEVCSSYLSCFVSKTNLSCSASEADSPCSASENDSSCSASENDSSCSASETNSCADGIVYREGEKCSKFYRYAAENWVHHTGTCHFSQVHVDFLKKRTNVEAFLHISNFYDFYGSREVRLTENSDQAIQNFTSLHIAALLGRDDFLDHLLRDTAIDANVGDYYRRTPLFIAACIGHDSIIKVLLKHDQIDVNAASRISLYTPLICAAQGNHVVAVELLLNTNGIDIGRECSREKTALWYAAVSGHIDVVRLLLGAQTDDPDMVRDMHSSALIGAVIMGNEAIVELIVKAGLADVNIRTTKQISPFCWGLHNDDEYLGSDNGTWGDPKNDEVWGNRCDHLAWEDEHCLNFGKSPFYLAVELERVNLIKLFLGMKDVNVDLKSDDGYTALFMAIENHYEISFQLLLESGRFDLNSRADNGQTPLMYAVSEGHEDLVLCLLRKGAVDINAIDNSGKTSMHIAADSAAGIISMLELFIYVVQPNINAKDLNGQTPLFIAAGRGDKAKVRLLLDTKETDIELKDVHGRELLSHAVFMGKQDIAMMCLATGEFDINARDVYGMTPLLLAAIYQPTKLGIIRELLDMDGVDFNARDEKYKRTPLMWAAHNGQLRLFKVLFNTGKYNADERGGDGLTPLEIAAKFGHTAIVKFLSTLGKDVVAGDRRFGGTAAMWAANRVHERIVGPLQPHTYFIMTNPTINGVHGGMKRRRES